MPSNVKAQGLPGGFGAENMSKIVRVDLPFQTSLRFDSLCAKGITLISDQGLSSGSIIVRTTAFEIAPSERLMIRNLELHKFVFVKPDDYAKDAANAAGFLAFGAMSFCNHANQPNAEIQWDQDINTTIISLVALNDIQSGDEITMRYANLDEYPESSSWLE
jgi:uncharacterized protein